MAKRVRRVAIITSYLPRKCGIATFASDLIQSLHFTAGPDFEPIVIAMQPDFECRYNEPVKFEIRRNVKNDYFAAAEYINCSHVDVLSVQHEFGLFGGPAGAYLSLLLRRVNVPIVSTLHTVLQEPPQPYLKSCIDLCELSDRIVVMNQRGISMLRDIYNVDISKVHLIPHGIPAVQFEESHYYKAKLGLSGRKTILTFGLLGRNKGIEVMLKALPEIVKADPSVLYIVLGATHPEVLKLEGEAYRFYLHRLARELGVADNVRFQNRFVSDSELNEYIGAADIYITPYLHKEQLTSGTLARAVGFGKPVVSTPYWAAEELLANGRGCLVPFGDDHRIAETVKELLGNTALCFAIRRKAWQYGTSMAWPRVGSLYWKLLTSKQLPVKLIVPTVEETGLSSDLPIATLTHLQRLTDDTGLYQHARYILPNREHGYCTDDNARAVLVMSKYYNQYAGREALRLLNLYLSFTFNAITTEGTVRNFMTFDRKWIDPEPAHDSLGRLLWAFGGVIANPPASSYVQIFKDYFDRCVKHVDTQSLRGKAYSIIGMADYLSQFPGASEIKRTLSAAADILVEHFHSFRGTDWQWFEDMLSYDNAVLTQALYAASRALGSELYLDVANTTCEFLLANSFNGNHFSFVGNNGWLKQGKQKAAFDQQPIEAASMVMMLKTAYEVTGRQNYLSLQRRAFDWFLGANELSVPVYDFKTEGCCDALSEQGVNINQGAESTLSFMLALLSVIETFASARPENEKSRQPVYVSVKPQHSAAGPKKRS